MVERANSALEQGGHMDQRWLLLAAAGVFACGGAMRDRTAKKAPTSEVRASSEVAGSQQSDIGNPFVGSTYFVNPAYTSQVEAAANSHPSDAASIRKLAHIPTAVWLDSIERAQSVTSVLQTAAQQASDGPPALTMFVVYDLPNRDCSAKSSAGELSSEAGGEQRYKSEFIDKIAEQFAAFPTQRIAVVLEPDSLPNLATNMNVPRCSQSDGVYRRSIAYAISKLSLPNVSIYLDAAHAGWLGWDANRLKIAKIFKDVLALAGGADKIRGFSTNVANFNTLSSAEGKRLGPSNPCPDELTYVAKLSESLHREGISGKQFVIDTSRNGRAVRTTWGNWCNVKGAGLGERPQAAAARLVDAYFWIKPPGESDGVSDPKQPRFDTACVSQDSANGAPQAGQWFESYFVDLVRNANPAL
jgi:cellulose 1,4-beta-cellobiosidase